MDYQYEAISHKIFLNKRSLNVLSARTVIDHGILGWPDDSTEVSYFIRNLSKKHQGSKEDSFGICGLMQLRSVSSEGQKYQDTYRKLPTFNLSYFCTILVSGYFNYWAVNGFEMVTQRLQISYNENYMVRDPFNSMNTCQIFMSNMDP